MGRSTVGRHALLVVLVCSAAWLGCAKFSEADEGTDDAGTPQEEAGAKEAGAAESGAIDGGGALPPFLHDTFTRTEATGWGLPDVGERWKINAPASVANGVGRMEPPIGQGVYAFTNPIPIRDIDVEAVFASSAITGPDGGLGGGLFFGFYVRAAPDNSFNYAASAIVHEGGVVGVGISARLPGAATDKRLARLTANPTVKAGEKLRLRFQVRGASPTALRAKVWNASDPEPLTWTAEATDETQVLQQAGKIGVSAYLSNNAGVAPEATVDDIIARPLP